VDVLNLGNVTYTKDELCSILNENVAGNCLISLAHQLIAAKINIANGASHECIDATIAQVDSLIGDLVVPPVGDGSLACNISGYIEALTAFNEGTSGCATHCGDSDPAPHITDNPCVVR
jgi:hypothetical protein